jgi:hypothetical protein
LWNNKSALICDIVYSVPNNTYLHGGEGLEYSLGHIDKLHHAEPGCALFFSPSNEPPMVNDLQKTLRETDSSVRQKVTIYV